MLRRFKQQQQHQQQKESILYLHMNKMPITEGFLFISKYRSNNHRTQKRHKIETSQNHTICPYLQYVSILAKFEIYA